METTLYSIFKRIEESVEQIKQSGLTDTDATNNLIQQAQILLSNIKGARSEKANNDRKRKADTMTPSEEPQQKKAKNNPSLPIIPCDSRGAYSIFLQESRAEMALQNPAAAKCGSSIRRRVWDAMTPEQRYIYEQKEKQDEERYAREVDEYIAKGGKMSPPDTSHRTVTADAPVGSESDNEESNSQEEAELKEPKRPKNGYLLWSEEARKSMPAELSLTEKVKLCAARYRTMSDEERKPWIQKATLAKEQYERDMKEYQERLQAQEQNNKEAAAPIRRHRTKRRKDDSDDEREEENEHGEDEKPTRRQSKRRVTQRKK
jgi:hypothetical protein